jgi:hypothetical protein
LEKNSNRWDTTRDSIDCHVMTWPSFLLRPDESYETIKETSIKTGQGHNDGRVA